MAIDSSDSPGISPELDAFLREREQAVERRKRRKMKTMLRLPAIAYREPAGIISVGNNAFANSVLPLNEPLGEEWAEWLTVLGHRSEKELTCVYCGKATDLHKDHLNATIIDNEPSGYFAEPGNLVPACHGCNTGRGNTPWEKWLRKKGAEQGDSEDVIEQRVAVMHRFLKRYKAIHLQCRRSGDEQRWAEYDHIRKEIIRLLTRAQEISKELRAAVTADYNKARQTAKVTFN